MVHGYPSPSPLLHACSERDGAPAPQHGLSHASCLTWAGKAQARAWVSGVCAGAAAGARFTSIVVLLRAGDQVAGAGGWHAASCSCGGTAGATHSLVPCPLSCKPWAHLKTRPASESCLLCVCVTQEVPSRAMEQGRCFLYRYRLNEEIWVSANRGGRALCWGQGGDGGGSAGAPKLGPIALSSLPLTENWGWKGVG